MWNGMIRELAACPNLHIKLGGLGMRMFGFTHHLGELPPSSEELAAAWRPYIETCIAAFGPQRAMFESNFPVDKGSCGYAAAWNAFQAHRRRLFRSREGRTLRRHCDEVLPIGINVRAGECG
jgi:predicted TIM-barrel fold metal-dependent hydrolase